MGVVNEFCQILARRLRSPGLLACLGMYAVVDEVRNTLQYVLSSFSGVCRMIPLTYTAADLTGRRLRLSIECLYPTRFLRSMGQETGSHPVVVPLGKCALNQTEWVTLV